MSKANEDLSLIDSADYFWRCKDRLDGFTDCELIEERFPALWAAWVDYQKARRVVGFELDDAHTQVMTRIFDE